MWALIVLFPLFISAIAHETDHDHEKFNYYALAVIWQVILVLAFYNGIIK